MHLTECREFGMTPPLNGVGWWTLHGRGVHSIGGTFLDVLRLTIETR